MVKHGSGVVVGWQERVRRPYHQPGYHFVYYEAQSGVRGASPVPLSEQRCWESQRPWRAMLDYFKLTYEMLCVRITYEFAIFHVRSHKDHASCRLYFSRGEIDISTENGKDADPVAYFLIWWHPDTLSTNSRRDVCRPERKHWPLARCQWIFDLASRFWKSLASLASRLFMLNSGLLVLVIFSTS